MPRRMVLARGLEQYLGPCCSRGIFWRTGFTSVDLDGGWRLEAADARKDQPWKCPSSQAPQLGFGKDLAAFFP